MTELRRFQAANWDEPLIFEMGTRGERGIAIGPADPVIGAAVGDVLESIPTTVRRVALPEIPEISQPQVLRHYLRLSQMTRGAHIAPDASLGTCTMKYSPSVNESIVRSEHVADLHPLQDDDTVQGLLEILSRLGVILKEISGLDEFSFQPGGGAQAIFANACIIRAYHDGRGEATTRDEIITTALSHPADSAAPAVAGFRVVTLMPDANGYPSVEALKAALSDRTAGLMMTNPDDTGIFNPHVAEFTRLVHEAGGLCAHDAANANGLLGIVRAREMGFDLCHFNLHKTFSVPHGSFGPASGVIGVDSKLARFLPTPVVKRVGDRYFLDHDRPDSIGRVRSFLGNPQAAVRAYAWCMAMGAEGLREVSESAVLNSSYLMSGLTKVPGVSVAFESTAHRLEQVRYSWQHLTESTGVTSDDMSSRLVDFGLQSYFKSHHPVIVPEPFSLEPAESWSKADLDEYIAVFAKLSSEAYSTPDSVKTAPHGGPIPKVDDRLGADPNSWAMTWRAFRRKYLDAGATG